jgi:hypothetical protein
MEAAATRALMQSVAQEDLNRASVLASPTVAAHPRLGQIVAPTAVNTYSMMSPAQRRKYNAQMAGISADIYGAGEEQDLGAWYEYWEDTESGYLYDNNATTAVYGINAPDNDASPAPITLMPTSTINPARPRTVAAGYDFQRQVLTVVFRDGTFYNYYSVDPKTWQQFRMITSKGRFIAKYLDSHPRGAAVVPSSAKINRQQLYRLSRGHQLYAPTSKVTSMNYKYNKRESHIGVSTRSQFYGP